MGKKSALVILGFVAAGICTVGRSDAAQASVASTRVAFGLQRPIFVTAPPGDLNRLFIVEQRGSGGVGSRGDIKIMNLPSGAINGTPYLSVTGLAMGNEEGLLGLAFHPDFLNNGYFWVYYTNSAGNNNVFRYQANAPFATSTTANAASATSVLLLSHPGQSNHNGGWIGFGPDGYLYVATGDGGSANDPPGNGQNINALLGKMLRLDVDGADNLPGNDDDDGVIGMTLAPYTNPPTNPFVGVAGADEIWSIGLRNPWRDSFDRATGALYIGDVGQNVIEEIDFQPGGMAPTPVRNYGWRCMEGNSCTGLTGCTCNAPELTLPIHDYNHAGIHCSVTGGYVYRGTAIPGLPGTYFFADYCSATIWSFRYNGTTMTEFTNRTLELVPDVGAINTITSFGEDGAGEVYICDQGGEIFRIIADIIDCNNNDTPDDQDIAGGTSRDCNANNTPDECDIAQGTSPDCNANAVPDSCDVTGGTSPDCNANNTPDECETDCNANGRPDQCDIAGGTSADCQPDGTPDDCQLSGNDCNADSTPDDCQLAGNDCDENSTPDECDLDCNGNGTPDACDVGRGTDCDTNGVPDECQVDCDGDGIPDTCEQDVVIFQDDFESDQGWTVESTLPVDGVWERADPVQTLFSGQVVQPDFDNPAGSGTLCYVTEASGPVTSSSDVDNGPTRLVSPSMDLSAGASTVRYAYWFHSASGTPDAMTLEVSNDNGSNWTPMTPHNVSASVWRNASVLVDDYISRTATMKFRFVISDPGNDSYTEGLVDDFVVTGPDCPSGCTPPPASIVSVCSNKTHTGGPCCITITGSIPAESSEPRAGGIEQLQVTFGADLCPEAFALHSAAVTIQETSMAIYPAFQPYGGPSVVATSGSGGILTLNFSPALADARAYRFTFTAGVTSLAGQSFDIRGLTADVTSSGRTDAGDRSAVVGAWTGPGFTCQTDITRDGITNSGDRSAVVGIWTSPNNAAP